MITWDGRELQDLQNLRTAALSKAPRSRMTADESLHAVQVSESAADSSASSQPSLGFRLRHWSSAQSMGLLTAATLLCLLPFSGKAFNVDDPLFLWSAQQIVRHPLDPFGFRLIWDTTLSPMSEITLNPPLACYYAAAIGAIAGWSERAQHLGFLLPALAMVVGAYRLARRFTRSPLIAAAATLLTPGTLVSATSVMCDTMMLALWIWAIIVWLEGLESGKQRLLLASSFLMAAAALTKYFAICLVPLLFAYSAAKQRRLGRWAWYFVLPVFLLAGYQLWTRALYGHAMFSLALGSSPQRLTHAWYLILMAPAVCASFIGGCALPALTLAPLLWPRRYILTVILLEGILAAVGWAIMGSHLAAFQLEWKIVGPQLALHVAAGVCVLALAVADLHKQRDADSLFLALWVFGTFVFTAFLNWIINARSVLPLIPAAGILLARRLDSLGIASLKPLRTKVAAALLASGFVSFWAARADADWADSARQVARMVQQRTKNEAVWFEGHWGFQYYMQQLGMHPLDFNKSVLSNGDLLVIPSNNYDIRHLPRQVITSDELLEIKLPQPVMTMTTFPQLRAGFYASSSHGPLPFAFGTAPPEQYHLLRIGSTTGPEQWPPRESMPR